MGCRLSDHGLDRFYFATSTAAEINSAFSTLLSGKTLSTEEAEKYKTAMMLELCRMNHKRGWTQQFHIGALRNSNSRMFDRWGLILDGIQLALHRTLLIFSKFLSELDRMTS